jgi:hypothetical protein
MSWRGFSLGTMGLLAACAINGQKSPLSDDSSRQARGRAQGLFLQVTRLIRE